MAEFTNRCRRFARVGQSVDARSVEVDLLAELIHRKASGAHSACPHGGIVRVLGCGHHLAYVDSGTHDRAGCFDRFERAAGKLSA